MQTSLEVTLVTKLASRNSVSCECLLAHCSHMHYSAVLNAPPRHHVVFVTDRWIDPQFFAEPYNCDSRQWNKCSGVKLSGQSRGRVLWPSRGLPKNTIATYPKTGCRSGNVSPRGLRHGEGAKHRAQGAPRQIGNFLFL